MEINGSQEKYKKTFTLFQRIPCRCVWAKPLGLIDNYQFIINISPGVLFPIFNILKDITMKEIVISHMDTDPLD